MNIKLDHCPLCNGGEIAKSLTAKDHLVTHEIFDIYTCKTCEVKFTNPRPSDDDLDKFYDSEEYISHTTEGNSLVNSLYIIARKFALRSKRNLIKKYAKSKTLLDVGCGTGHFMAFCQKDDWQVSGVEPNKVAKVQAEKNTFATIYNEISEVKNQQFDIITLWHVLEHLPNLNLIIGELKELLKPNGTLIVAVPNYEAFEESKFKEFWAAYDVPRHLYHFNKNALESLTGKHGLNIVNISPMWLDSFYISLLSNKNMFGRNKYLSSFITGLLSNVYAINSKNTSSLIYHIKKGE